MGRKFKIRYEKNFFDPQLGVVGSGATKYVDAFNRDAAQRIQLHKLTARLRKNVNIAAPANAHIPTQKVIYGISNTNVFKPVTAETLTKRRGIAETIEPLTNPPRDKMNYRKSVRARAFAEMHRPFIEATHGPWEAIR